MPVAGDNDKMHFAENSSSQCWYCLANYFSLKQEKGHLTTEVEQLKDRLALMNQEFDTANEDRVKLTEKSDELKKKIQHLVQEKDAAQRNRLKEVCWNIFTQAPADVYNTTW